jgi:DNA-binding NtrC family response regulator
LRERREDVMPLARYFAERMAESSSTSCISFSRDAVQLLESYDWPGNIRELENAIVRAAALCDQAVRPEDLPERVRNFSAPPPPAQAHAQAAPTGGEDDGEDLLSLAEVEGRHIFRVLARTGGNKQAAARVLGIDRTTLQRKLERYNLEQNGHEEAAKEPRG